MNVEAICINVFVPTYVRGGLADGVLGSEASLSLAGAGAGSSTHRVRVSRALDVGVVV